MSSRPGPEPSEPESLEGRPTPGSETLRRLLAPPGRRRAATGFALAVVGPAVVTVVARAGFHRSTAVPALLYMLAVVGAAALGRIGPGLLAAALSFVGLDYFFTPPRHTFAVAKAEDLIVLVVFLLVAAAVSASISAALEQRNSAELRSQQVQALSHVSDRLLAGDRLESVLGDLAAALRALYGLDGCRVMVAEPDGALRERASSGRLDAASVRSVALVAGGRTVGRIDMAAGPGGATGAPELPRDEVLQTFAGQLALALERARLGAEAEEARVEAEASRMRAALFSSVTHDLRTPLASITASATSLLEEGVPFSEEQRRELLRTIFEESQRLNRLVGNIMDLSRLRAGALTPALEAVPVEDLVSSVLERLRPSLAGRPLRVILRDDVPPVLVDPVQMDQALTNVLENALRYSPEGSEVAVVTTRWGDTAEIRVADRGPGIPPEERDRVFEEFHRRDVAGRRGGTGLGLAIARAIVSAHGGSIWIEGTPGGGTTVRLRIPLAPSPSPSPSPSRPTPSTPSP